MQHFTCLVLQYYYFITFHLSMGRKVHIVHIHHSVERGLGYAIEKTVWQCAVQLQRHELLKSVMEPSGSSCQFVPFSSRKVKEGWVWLSYPLYSSCREPLAKIVPKHGGPYGELPESTSDKNSFCSINYGLIQCFGIELSALFRVVIVTSFMGFISDIDLDSDWYFAALKFKIRLRPGT